MKKKGFFLIYSFLILSGFSSAQNLISKDQFYKSMSLDPVITLNNRSNKAIDCVIIDYKVDGGQMMQYKSEGILPANTSVEIPLPRIQVKDGLHYFDASVKTVNGQSLKGQTFAEGLSFALSPGIKVQTGLKSTKTEALKSEDSAVTSGCTCENGEGLDEEISFWFSMFDNDTNQLDAFGSANKGRDWIHGKWINRAKDESQISTMAFSDPRKPGRKYELLISKKPLTNLSLMSEMAGMKNGIQVKNNLTAFPNPFTNKVSISYMINNDSEVSLQIVDIQGKLIANPLSRIKHDPGNYSYQYLDNKLAPGVYQCILIINGKEQSIKIIKK